MAAPYDVAAAFKCAWRSAQARHDITRGGMVRASFEDDLLIVQVLHMPPASFDTRFLRNGPGHGVPLFSPVGDAYWGAVSDLAVQTAQGADQVRGLAAIMLMPSALESAREALPVAA